MSGASTVLGSLITIGMAAIVGWAIASSGQAAEPAEASEQTSAPAGESTPMACLPDPLGLNGGERTPGAVVDDALAHSPLGQLNTALEGGEPLSFTLPTLNLLPSTACLDSFDASLAGPGR